MWCRQGQWGFQRRCMFGAWQTDVLMCTAVRHPRVKLDWGCSGISLSECGWASVIVLSPAATGRSCRDITTPARTSCITRAIPVALVRTRGHPPALHQHEHTAWRANVACCVVHIAQVAERSLFLWNNEYIVNLVAQHRQQLLPIVLPALEENTSSHWNPAVHGLTVSRGGEHSMHTPV